MNFLREFQTADYADGVGSMVPLCIRYGTSLTPHQFRVSSFTNKRLRHLASNL